MSDACMNVRIERECGIVAASRNPSSSYAVSMNRLERKIREWSDFMITACATRRALKPSLLRRRSWVVIIEVARDQLDILPFV
jgi:hypothetical protein